MAGPASFSLPLNVVHEHEIVDPFGTQVDEKVEVPRHSKADGREGECTSARSGSGTARSFGMSSPGTRSEKVARLVTAGLPWPTGAEQNANDTRQLVVSKGVPWHEDKDVNDFYELTSPLGTGGFAKVYKGKNKQTGEVVAIKHIMMLEDGDSEVVYKEVKHLTMLKDVKQVVEIHEAFESGSNFHIVMELCKGGELHASFEEGSNRTFTYGDIGRTAVCMLMLVDAMHSRGLVHCDLKPENFCLAESLDSGVPIMESLRLIDFGLSQRVRGGQAIAGLAGSIPYMAPEIKSRMYDHKVDVWSVGVIIYTLLHGKLPFDGRSAEEIMSKAATHKPDVSAVHPAVGSFLLWLLTKDPKKRPDAREALGHPWLKVTSSRTEGGDAYKQSVSNEVLQNLSIFAASNKLQRAFMHLAVGFMQKSEMQKMLSMFNTLSADRHKPLPAQEITRLLSQGKSPEEAEKVTKTVELVMGKTGDLTIDDFIVSTMNQYRNLSDAVIKTMFKALDKDGDGWITAQDAFDALHPTGVHISVKELTKLFDRYGVKRRLGNADESSGIMTYHEFHELMMPSVSQRYTTELDDVVAAFKGYHSSTPFQKLVRRIVAEHAPATKEMARISKAFHTLDKDRSGTLTKEQLSHGVRSAGYVVSDADMNELFLELDTDGTGLVRYHEFVAGALDNKILVGDSLLRWLFDYLDDDDSKTINSGNVKRILDVMDWSDSEKNKIWETACGPGNHDCDLSFDEFKALVQGEGGRNFALRVQAGATAVSADDNCLHPPPELLSVENSFMGEPSLAGSIHGPSVSLPAPTADDAASDCSSDSDISNADEGKHKPALLTRRKTSSSPSLLPGGTGHLDTPALHLATKHQLLLEDPKAPTTLPTFVSGALKDQEDEEATNGYMTRKSLDAVEQANEEGSERDNKGYPHSAPVSAGKSDPGRSPRVEGAEGWRMPSANRPKKQPWRKRVARKLTRMFSRSRHGGQS